MIETLLLTAILTASPNLPEKPPAPVAAKSDPNQTGRQPSAYTGKYYHPDLEPYRQCVGQREGRFQYWVTGSNGFYESTYQMTDALVRGAAWMITPELKRTYGPEKGREIRDTLLDTPGSRWSRFYMDMAFWTILNWEHKTSGAHHWAGGRFSCQPGMSNYGGNR